MDIQELYLRSYEFALDEDPNQITDREYQFIINKLNSLNELSFFSEEDKFEAKILFAILLNFDQDMDSIKLSKLMQNELNLIIE